MAQHDDTIQSKKCEYCTTLNCIHCKVFRNIANITYKDETCLVLHHIVYQHAYIHNNTTVLHRK